MQLVEKMCVNPAKLYHFDKGYLAEGKDADIVIFNENEEWTVTDAEIASKSHNTPFTLIPKSPKKSSNRRLNTCSLVISPHSNFCQ